MSPLRQHHGISVDTEEKKLKLKGKTLSSVFWGGVFAKFFPQTHVFKHLEHLCELLCNIIVKNAVENWRDRTLVSWPNHDGRSQSTRLQNSRVTWLVGVTGCDVKIIIRHNRHVEHKSASSSGRSDLLTAVFFLVDCFMLGASLWAGSGIN